MSEQQKYHHGDLKRAITEAALEMAAESGYESLSLREIARRIGVTTAAPYHHFKDRQSLLIELAIQGYEALFEALIKARGTATAKQDQFLVDTSAYLRFGYEHSALYAIMRAGEFATHARFQEMLHTANRSLELVRQSIAVSSGLDQSKSAEAAFCAWSLLHGILALDRNGVLFESIAEQERLARQGVLSIVRGMTDARSSGNETSVRQDLKSEDKRPA